MRDLANGHGLTVYIGYGGLSLLNLYYLVRVLRLKDKKFHLLMFTILEVGYLSYIMRYAEIAHADKYWDYFFGDLYVSCDNLAHTIFVTKYWVLSRKLQEPERDFTR